MKKAPSWEEDTKADVEDAILRTTQRIFRKTGKDFFKWIPFLQNEWILSTEDTEY